MVKRIAALLLVLWMIPFTSTGELSWKLETPAQNLLKAYIENVNRALTEAGEEPVNRLFEIYTSFAVLGMTATDDAEVPESVEITVRMFYDTLNSLELRVSALERFPVIAAAFLQALSSDETETEAILNVPMDRVKKAMENPVNSYEEPVEELNGTVPRVYYAYYPNQYKDGVSWMQMTVIFPMEGSWNGQEISQNPLETQGPDTWSDHDPEYEGYNSQDDYTHLEVFTTTTPEPDSAAGEYDLWSPNR